MAVGAKYSRNRPLNAGWVGTLRAGRSKPMGGRDLRGNEMAPHRGRVSNSCDFAAVGDQGGP